MEIVDIPTPRRKVLAYNEAHKFTRRNPTFLTDKQQARDVKIAKQLITAGDIEGDYQKVMEIFFTKCHLLSDPRYWEMLRTVWCLCGSTENAHRFRPLFLASRRAKSWFMTPEDTHYLDSLDFPVKLYRAYEHDDDPGISWTNDKEWCEEYARCRGRKIKEAFFDRNDIYAYVSRRGESEFIIIK